VNKSYWYDIQEAHWVESRKFGLFPVGHWEYSIIRKRGSERQMLIAALAEIERSPLTVPLYIQLQVIRLAPNEWTVETFRKYALDRIKVLS
jgi:hypothetical protein